MASHSDRDGVTGKDCRRCYTWKPLNDYYSSKINACTTFSSSLVYTTSSNVTIGPSGP